MKIDIFNHIIPQKYFDKMVSISPRGKDIQKRVRAIPSMVDLDVRFRIMDLFEEYVQVICLANPPIEALGPPPVSREMAELANDSMAELVKKYPDRFPGFIASDSPFDPEKGPGYIRSTIEIIDSLDLTPEHRQAIYEGNARRLLKLK